MTRSDSRPPKRPSRKSAVEGVAAATAATKDTPAEIKANRLAKKHKKAHKVTEAAPQTLRQLKRALNPCSAASTQCTSTKWPVQDKPTLVSRRQARLSSITTTEPENDDASSDESDLHNDPVIDPSLGDLGTTDDEENFEASDVDDLAVRPVDAATTKQQATTQNVTLRAQVSDIASNVAPPTAAPTPHAPTPRVLATHSMPRSEIQLCDAILPSLIAAMVSTPTDEHCSVTEFKGSFWPTVFQIKGFVGALMSHIKLPPGVNYKDNTDAVIERLANKRSTFLSNVMRETQRILVPELELGTITQRGVIDEVTEAGVAKAVSMLKDWRRADLFWEPPRIVGDTARPAAFFRNAATMRITCAILSLIETPTFGGHAIPPARSDDDDVEGWHEERDMFFGALSLAACAMRHALTKIAQNDMRLEFSGANYQSLALTHWKWLRGIGPPNVQTDLYQMQLVDELRELLNARRRGTTASSNPPSEPGDMADEHDDEDPFDFGAV